MLKYFIEPNGNGIFEVEVGETNIFGLSVIFVKSKSQKYYREPEEFLSWCVDDIQTAKEKRKELIESHIKAHTETLEHFKQLQRELI
jgi:vacuolar-type H+-ATPase subunit D/Vma8